MQKKIKINGTTWALKLITAKEMRDLRDDGVYAGLCSVGEKTIYFDKAELDYPTVLHELFHAYASDLHLGDTHDISLHDIEEIFASMFTDKAEKIIRQARRVCKQLTKMLEGT